MWRLTSIAVRIEEENVVDTTRRTGVAVGPVVVSNSVGEHGRAEASIHIAADQAFF